jgi:hypothetical protein
MAALLFLAALVLGGGFVVFKEAADLIPGGTAPWAYDVCGAAPMFCSHPDYLMVAAGIALVLAIGAKLGAALGGN